MTDREVRDADAPMTGRFCRITRLKPEHRERYLELHANVWPGVEQRMRESNFVEYSIFLRGDLLVAYFEYAGTDYDGDMRRVQEDPESQRWWRETDPCQEDPDPDAPGSSPWRELREVWHLSDAPRG